MIFFEDENHIFGQTIWLCHSFLQNQSTKVKRLYKDISTLILNDEAVEQPCWLDQQIRLYVKNILHVYILTWNFQGLFIFTLILRI